MRFFKSKANEIYKTIKNRLQTKASIVELFFWCLFILSLVFKSRYVNVDMLIIPKFWVFSLSKLPILVFDLFVFSTLACLLVLLFRKQRYMVALLINILISICYLADVVYFRYYFSAVTIQLIHNIKLLGSVKQSLLDLFLTRDSLLFLDIPVLLLLIKILKVNQCKIHLNFKKVSLLFAICFTMFSMLWFTDHMTQKYYGKVTSEEYNRFGVNYFHLKDIHKNVTDAISLNKKLTESEKNSIKQFFVQKEKSKYSNDQQKLFSIAKDKNLIILQVEALQKFVIHQKINGVEITPNLNAFAKNSLYFNNIYTQVSLGNTSDAEFMLHNSIYPSKDGAANYLYPDNTYHSLPQTLKSLQYNTYISHGYIPSFWNRHIMFNNYKYLKFFNYNDFVIDEKVGWSGNALSDRSFYRQTLQKIKTDKPFLLYMISLSSHLSYTVNESLHGYTLPVGKYQKTLFGDYLDSIHYADKSIGYLLQELKKRGLYDNSVIVILGDHHGLPHIDSEKIPELLKIENSYPNFLKQLKVPVMIHYPGQDKGKTYSLTGGQIDILPTVSNIMGVDLPYAMGKDLVNSKAGYALITTTSNVVTDRFIYDTTKKEVYDIKTNAVLNLDQHRQEIEEIQKEYQIADLILRKDAFKTINLFKK